MRIKTRAAALILSLVGAAVNSFVAARVLSFWRVLKWESESEWEGSPDSWRVDSLKLVWLLVTAYFTTASVVCVIGAIGVIKRTPAFVRLYRDYSLADICFCGLLTVGAALASFRPSARATICEEISGQPELLRDLADAGLNPENCEQWFEHAVLGFVAITAILLVVRYYKLLLRQRTYGFVDVEDSDVPLGSVETSDGGKPQRVYLLPARPAQEVYMGSASLPVADGSMLVYAPVPIESLSETEARELASNEARIRFPVPILEAIA
ncbi:hypothetical protein A7U60_g7680 [Sanghuangporus baumii]|uniref:Uncharacterized protein n=1 Tax=Sanghuangporus baumii TaxID=108892 RepID=A0A9Q5HSZ6_SANBA|nr:hypothetical protein A7U60_g7680 [Sanghuangporus baumii]